MPQRTSTTGNTIEKFTGKERDESLGLDYFGARYYDAALWRWHSTDPMQSERTWVSPYNYAQNNPISRFDPTGALDAPIYNTEGEFLGTDDEGLTGKYIVMDETDFTQGMSHDDALSKGLGAKGLSSDRAKSNLLTHYNGLKDRPDYDGFVSVDEGIDWARAHPGAKDNPTPDNMLYINTGTLDFGNISTSQFSTTNQSTPINLLNSGNLAAASYNATLRGTVYALGRVNMTLNNASTRSVSIVNDYNLPANRATDYDWNRGGTFLRRTLMDAERKRTGLNDKHGFRVFYYGTGTLNE